MVDTRGNDARTVSREEERRRREEAHLIALQQQVDELRHLLREQIGRQQRLEEQLRQGDSHMGQVRVDLDDVRQELHRFMQVRNLEDQRIRQQIADAQARAEEPLRPLRTVQAQMADVLELTRHQRERDDHAERQIAEVRAQVDTFRADILRALEIARQAKEALDGIGQTHTAVTRDIQRISDQSRLVEQEARRRLADLEQTIANTARRVEEVAGYRPMLEEGIRQVHDEIQIFQPQIDALAQKDRQLAENLGRAQAAAEERDAAVRERVEELRSQLTNEVSHVADAGVDATQGIHDRIGNWEEAQKDLIARLGALAVQVSALQQRDDRIAGSVRRAEERLVRLQLEQAQAAWEALMERRTKDSEGQ